MRLRLGCHGCGVGDGRIGLVGSGCWNRGMGLDVLGGGDEVRGCSLVMLDRRFGIWIQSRGGE